MTAYPEDAACKKAVARGAKWLDKHEPGWAHRIDPDAIVMSNECRCVLGLLYQDDAGALGIDGFSYGVTAAVPEASPSERITWAEKHGFDESPDHGHGYTSFTGLRVFWRKAIAARVSA